MRLLHTSKYFSKGVPRPLPLDCYRLIAHNSKVTQGLSLRFRVDPRYRPHLGVSSTPQPHKREPARNTAPRWRRRLTPPHIGVVGLVSFIGQRWSLSAVSAAARTFVRNFQPARLMRNRNQQNPPPLIRRTGSTYSGGIGGYLPRE